MVRLKKFVKAYEEAGAFNSLLAPHRFVDQHVFLTKGSQVGVVLRVRGIDYECLTESTLESHTKRAAAAWRSFDERFRLYQYIVKQDRAPIYGQSEYHQTVVCKTVEARKTHLESKSAGLYTIELFYVLVYEQPALTRGRAAKRSLSTKQILRVATDELKRNCTILLGRAKSFQRSMDDLLGTTFLEKGEAFSFFRLLVNLDPEIAASESLKHDSHIDYYMPSLSLTCTSEGIRIGQAQLEILSLKEPLHHTFPNILRNLLALEVNFIICSEFQRVLNCPADLNPSHSTKTEYDFNVLGGVQDEEG